MPMQIIKLPVHIIFHTWHSLYWKFHFISCLHWQNPRPTPPTAWRSGTTQVFPWWCHLLLKKLSHHRCHEDSGYVFHKWSLGPFLRNSFWANATCKSKYAQPVWIVERVLAHYFIQYFHWQLRKLCVRYTTCPKPPANHVDVNLREDTLKPPSSPKRKKTQKILSLTFQQSALSLQPGWFSYFLR